MKTVRRTKIICTIGPASQDEKILRELIKNGMNVARLNFSHGSHEEHLEKMRRIKRISLELKTPVAIMQDLCGPKIRLGYIPGGPITVAQGDEIIISTRHDATDISPEKQIKTITTVYEHLPKDVKKGDRILIDDGSKEVLVVRVDGEDILCRVVVGGKLSSHKGLNLPGVAISSPTITEKDKQDLEFGIKNKVDYVALSFVRSADDVKELKKILHKSNSDIQVISKIERPEGVNDIEEILKVTDGIMVARGDLGLEMDLEQVPAIQKRLLDMACNSEKPAITATQMLESMVENPSPTRAEVSDVANAILDGSDAIMLSGETAAGKYPLNALQMMDKIACETEKYFFESHTGDNSLTPIDRSSVLVDAISKGVCQITQNIGIKVIAALTQSGATPRFLSKYRSSAVIIGVTSNERTIGKMCLDWGVVPFLGRPYNSTAELLDELTPWAAKQGLIRDNEYIALVAGVPLGMGGTTNMLEIQRARGKFLPRGERVRETTVSRRAEGMTHYFMMDVESCIGCGVCQKRCPADIFQMRAGKAYVNKEKIDDCLLDMQCVKKCPVEGIKIVPKTEDKTTC